MIQSKELFEVLKQQDLSFITGVPCSTYRDFLIYVNNHEEEITHIRATSEGESIGIAAGYYLATQKVPLVYMQNSGLGNAINPLTSLMDKEVYSIPALLFVSWRAEPGQHDEPQHKKMGRIMCDMLDVLEIPHEMADSNLFYLARQIKKMKEKALQERMPVALIFRQGILAKDQVALEEKQYMTREEVLETLLAKIGKNIVVSTTGKASREIYEIREKSGEGHQFDFLTVGSLGCASSIGLGIAKSQSKNVYIIDGDGSLLMKMGTLATIGNYKPKNLAHILIDNGVHESTGGQPTVSRTVHWEGIFQAVGYQSVMTVETRDELGSLKLDQINGPLAVVIRVSPGSRDNLGRPATTPAQNKEGFMEFLFAQKEDRNLTKEQ